MEINGKNDKQLKNVKKPTIWSGVREKKNLGVVVHLLDTAIREESHKYLIEKVHHLLVLVPSAEQLISDTELMSQEFGTDTYYKVLHPHTQGHLPRLLEVT